MTRIDRYILMLFVRVFLTCYVCLTGLLIVVHLFTNLDDLIDAGKANDRSATDIMLSYYIPYSLSLFTRLCPFFALMALLFVVAWLKRTNELTALMAAGIPKGRILRYPLIAVVSLICCSTFLREFVIPRHQDILGKQPQDLSGDNFRPMRPALDPTTEILIGGHHVELLHERIIHPIFRLSGYQTQFGKQIKAHVAKYEKANEQHPAGYHVQSIITPENIATFDSLTKDGQPVVLTSKQHPWLAPSECFVVSTVPFFLLQGGSNWSQYESTWNIVRRLHAQPTFFGPDVHVTAHTRMVQPLLDITMILFGLPVVLRRVDRHLFWIAGAVMGSVLIFFALSSGFQSVAASNKILSPFLGAWLPVLILCPIAWARVRIAVQS